MNILEVYESPTAQILSALLFKVSIKYAVSMLQLLLI